jgi:hypothetical protein
MLRAANMDPAVSHAAHFQSALASAIFGDKTHRLTDILRSNRQIKRSLGAQIDSAPRPLGLPGLSGVDEGMQMNPVPTTLRTHPGDEGGRSPVTRRPQPAQPHGSVYDQIGDLRSQLSDSRQLQAQIMSTMEEAGAGATTSPGSRPDKLWAPSIDPGVIASSPPLGTDALRAGGDEAPSCTVGDVLGLPPAQVLQEALERALRLAHQAGLAMPAIDQGAPRSPSRVPPQTDPSLIPPAPRTYTRQHARAFLCLDLVLARPAHMCALVCCAPAVWRDATRRYRPAPSAPPPPNATAGASMSTSNPQGQAERTSAGAMPAASGGIAHGRRATGGAWSGAPSLRGVHTPERLALSTAGELVAAADLSFGRVNEMADSLSEELMRCESRAKASEQMTRPSTRNSPLPIKEGSRPPPPSMRAGLQ